MYKLLAIAFVLLLVGCSPDNPISEFNEQTNIAGQVISEVFDPSSCVSDSRCPVGHRCVNNTCVPKN